MEQTTNYAKLANDISCPTSKHTNPIIPMFISAKHSYLRFQTPVWHIVPYKTTHTQIQTENIKLASPPPVAQEECSYFPSSSTPQHLFPDVSFAA